MHDTEDPTRSSAADAAGMAADYSARATYARGYDDGRKAEKARADAAEQRVAELREAASDMRPFTGGAPSRVSDAFDAALSSTADIAGRWCPVAERDAAIAASDEAINTKENVILQRDAAIARAEKLQELIDVEGSLSAEELDEVRAERDTAIVERNLWHARAEKAEAKLETLTAWADKAERAPGEIALHYRELLAAAERARDEAVAERDELRRNSANVRAELLDVIEEAAGMQGHHEKYVDAVRRIARARDELGIQYAAAQAEIARMRPVVEACRTAVVKWRAGEPYDLGHYMMSASAALDALDTVPGDALAPKSRPPEAPVARRLAELEGLLRRAHAAWVGTGPAIDLETMERELANALPPTSPAGASAQPSNVKGGE